MNLLGYDYSGILKLVRQHRLGGPVEAREIFYNLYNEGRIARTEGFDQAAEERFFLELPPVLSSFEEEGTIKFTLGLKDGLETETIIIPMSGYHTLCVSSQIGCHWGCTFCETGKMGFLRNLEVEEILAQLMTARQVFRKDIRNLVFMGMGEALDNFDAVFQSIDVITHPWGLGMSKKSICISTVGQMEGLQRFSDRIHRFPDRHYHKIHLAVSLNAADDETRNGLMPVNRRWPMDVLKKGLQRMPQFGKKDLLFFEYILIEGWTDGAGNAQKLIDFASAFPQVVINLIPYNPGRSGHLKTTPVDERKRFQRQLMDAGFRTYLRYRKGDRIRAACGQLGNRKQAVRRD